MHHLTSDQIADLRARLERKLEKLRSYNQAMEAEDPANDPERVNDNAESGDEAMEAYEMLESESLTMASEAIIKEVEAALERFTAGTYGIDEVTGEPIAYERLRLLPEARTAASTAADTVESTSSRQE